MRQFVCSFAEGSKDMESLLGSKGASLAEMTKTGLPVPFGFTVTTEACMQYYEDSKVISEDILQEIFEKLKELENVTGKYFGDAQNPLLVSVRAGTQTYVPGVMDAVLNLGLNDETAGGLSELSGNESFAYDSYKMFIRMFGETVMHVPKDRFEAAADSLDGEDSKKIAEAYKAVIFAETNEQFPQNPKSQLIRAVEAAFESWNSDEAENYRQQNKIPFESGAAVSVQSMVFGNMGSNSGSGMACTRNPETGDRELFGKFVVNTQGEILLAKEDEIHSIDELAQWLPDVYRNFVKIAELLEKHYHDAQDIEFTIENGKLYILQTGRSELTPIAAVKTAVDMEAEKLIDKRTALLRIRPQHVDMLFNKEYSEDLMSELSDYLSVIMKWTDEIGRLKIRTNVDDLFDAEFTVKFGADGIGLCRTESTFLRPKRVSTVMKMILADSEEERNEAINVLLPIQTADFRKLFETVGEKPIAIRLLDSLPYHEFEAALGHRGCRIAIAYPEIAAMQVKAIITAALEVKKEKGIEIAPEIMVPLVSMDKEFIFVKKTIVETAECCFEELGDTVEYSVGAMIEVPRAALTADQLAREADFFSFGMNDLTQMTFGLSNENNEKIVKEYMGNLILEDDPFSSIDRDGVGKLVRMASELGKSVKPNLKMGMCGDHAGDPNAVEFCCNIGMSYISCPPMKVPAAKLTAAQYVVRSEDEVGTAVSYRG
ncbi:MAG: hypothetical protein HFG67_00885 [Firmicutes bacterium]|nr:hypothetical protein [Bacillota bacterium]